MLYSYYCGLDLGQSSDYSALSLIEEPVWVPDALRSRWRVKEAGWISPAAMLPNHVEEALSWGYRRGRPHAPPLFVRHLERFELGTRYPTIVERVKTLLTSAPLADRRVALVVDKTGVGTPPFDYLLQGGLRPIAITIHGGGKVGRERDGYRVPKRDLAAVAQVLLQNRRLKVASALPLAGTLEKELLNFRVKIDPRTAHDSYEHWREGDHDDLVLATAMACWFRQFWNARVDAANAAREAREALFGRRAG